MMRLAAQDGCRPFETSSILVRGAAGSERRAQRGFQHRGRGFDSFPARRKPHDPGCMSGGARQPRCSGSCRRLHSSFAWTRSGCDSRRVHGLVRKVAGLLGREVIRVRFPAGPPGLCVRTRRSLARSARRCDSGQVHHAGLFKEAPPLVSASRRERYPRPAPPNDHGDHGPLVRAPVRFDSGVRLSWVGNVSLVQPTSVPALFPTTLRFAEGSLPGNN